MHSIQWNSHWRAHRRVAYILGGIALHALALEVLGGALSGHARLEVEVHGGGAWLQAHPQAAAPGMAIVRHTRPCLL